MPGPGTAEMVWLPIVSRTRVAGVGDGFGVDGFAADDDGAGADVGAVGTGTGGGVQPASRATASAVTQPSPRTDLTCLTLQARLPLADWRYSPGTVAAGSGWGGFRRNARSTAMPPPPTHKNMKPTTAASNSNSPRNAY